MKHHLILHLAALALNVSGLAALFLNGSATGGGSGGEQRFGGVDAQRTGCCRV